MDIINAKVMTEVDGIQISLTFEEAKMLRQIMGNISVMQIRQMLGRDIFDDDCMRYRDEFVRPLLLRLNGVLP